MAKKKLPKRSRPAKRTARKTKRSKRPKKPKKAAKLAKKSKNNPRNASNSNRKKRASKAKRLRKPQTKSKAGNLIVSALQKKNSSKRGRLTQKGKKRKSKKGNRFSFFVPRGKTVENGDLSLQNKPNKNSKEDLPAHPPSDASKQFLMSNQLVRPGPELQSSIEGFFLDQRSENTRRAYGKDLKRFIKYLIVRIDSRGPEKIDRTMFAGYKEWLLSEGLEHTTVDRHLAMLRGLFRWFVEDGHIDQNPAEKVRFLRPKNISKTNGFSDSEVRKILRKPNLHTRVGSQHQAILMILFYCGLRRSELCSLKTSHLQEERGQLYIRMTGKGNIERIVPINRDVARSIFHFLTITKKDVTKDQYLFSPIRNNKTGDVKKPLDPSSIFYIVKKYAELSGVMKKVSPHSCRATAISNARDHNVSDRAIQEFAGWLSTDMITRYDKRKTALKNSAAHSIKYDGD